MSALMILSACTDRSTSSPPSAGSVRDALPAACELVTGSDVSSAIGAATSIDSLHPSRDRCRYVSGRGDEVEITVDRPGLDGVVATYRALHPDAQAVNAVGEDAALRSRNGAGELVFVKGPARFFVVVTGPSSSPEALLAIARAAAERM